MCYLIPFLLHTVCTFQDLVPIDELKWKELMNDFTNDDAMIEESLGLPSQVWAVFTFINSTHLLEYRS